MKNTSVSIDPVTDMRFELVRPLGAGTSGAVFPTGMLSGVMLYEAISGGLPINGGNAAMLMQRKLSEEPRPLVTGAPQEVLNLCMGLLARDPKRRPAGENVLRVLAAVSGKQLEALTIQEHLTIEPLATTLAQALFGREVELSQLRAASDNLAQDRSLVIHVRGTSGSGKSALVEQFLDEAAAELSPPIVLRSRCYEREAMPFKALDGAMDALVGYLSQLDDISCAHLLPMEVSELARLFPVVERLRAVQRLRVDRKAGSDETMIRRRAEQALRAHITSVAGQRPLLLWIDDMQWSDLDSASVLCDWLASARGAGCDCAERSSAWLSFGSRARGRLSIAAH